MLKINHRVSIPEAEIEINAIRASGPGGQNVNKVASAIHLRFDVQASSLPDSYKKRLLTLKDKRINKDGVIVIKALSHRTRERNRAEAEARLVELIQNATHRKKFRVPTTPAPAARQRRLDSKARRGRLKRLRGSIPFHE